MYVAPMSECLRNFKFLFNGCGRVCSDQYEPVCGTDMKTYSNQCFLEMSNCRARSEFHDGALSIGKVFGHKSTVVK